LPCALNERRYGAEHTTYAVSVAFATGERRMTSQPFGGVPCGWLTESQASFLVENAPPPVARSPAEQVAVAIPALPVVTVTAVPGG
jgi:hypothetical protein